MRLALFGGTFDPIHAAHLKVAREAAVRFALDRVLFVPAARPPHKGDATSAAYHDRYRMVELACRGEPAFEASSIEAGDTVSYSISTVEKVRAMLAPGDELFFLIGADAFAEIRTWFRWQDVIRLAEFLVVTRPGHTYQVPAGARVHALETVALPVSSSDLRARLAAGESPPEILPEVLAYIRERGLYK
ncbi:MAG: nicotinate (nicotinamide) nucleotide adenylyltransferase [Acidobacteria bacterium]|nr:nicotinate (nicotinamide) nucleotide adenylyltransferase [Acidobacteriota bacterium]